MRQPIDYAKAACDTMMRKYKAEDLPPKGHFHYHQGVFLSGMYKNYLICREEKYFTYMKDWVDSVMDDQGVLKNCDRGKLDDIQPGILLFPLIERTGEEKYKKALDWLMDGIWNFPRNPQGGFWHMSNLPDQMWLDGLYMGGPISAEYGKKYHKPEFIDLAAQQAVLMEKNTRDEKTGLWYHAWDYSRKAEWADKDTGLSPEFWGRAMGWAPVAVLDELDFMDRFHPMRGELESLVRRLLSALCRYQSQSGLWYQVVDKEKEAGNWPEISCSCLYTAAMFKGVRKGILSKDYLAPARKGLKGVIDSLIWEGDDVLIGGVCIGTGVGDYEHYCKRPVCVNDLHGVGAFLLMCAEAQNAEAVIEEGRA